MQPESVHLPADLLREITEAAQEIYRGTLDPLGERLLHHLRSATGERQAHPLVLVLGSHSSGKSTLINHLLGREVQKTGVAPTDDGFTLLTAGPIDEDRDGATAAGTPGLGLAGLSRFGAPLLSHLALKIRAGCPLLEELWLVDSPGMIDAASESIDRGYDFFGVLRWFADHADVILLLFDPEKPGTTGETLRALTSSLLGLDHKLLVILNKADAFRSIGDFARAYGALCWNLAKVIPRKDLPRIYTCYVPGPGRPAGDGTVPVADFDQARQEILAEVRRAPERRIDNVVTRMETDAQEILVFARVMDTVRRECAGLRFWARLWALSLGGLAGLTALGLSLARDTLGFTTPPYALLLVSAVGLVLTIGLLSFGQRRSRRRGQKLIGNLTPVFERLYQRALVIADAGELSGLWARLHGRIEKAMGTITLDRLPRISRRELRRLEAIVGQEVPALRARLYGRNQV